MPQSDRSTRVVIRASATYKRQTALGLAVLFLIPASLLVLSFCTDRIDYRSGYRLAALIATALAFFVAASFSAPLWRPFFALTEPGLLIHGRHLVPWSVVKSATVVTVLGESILGFRLRLRSFDQLPASTRRAVTSGSYWPRAHLAAAAPVHGITPGIADVCQALSHYGVAIDDRPHRVEAE